MEQSLQQAIRNSTVVFPEHQNELIERLENFPYGLEKWLYRTCIVDTQSLYQADIIIKVPTCFINEVGKPAKGVDIVCLISATCDMQDSRKEFIVAAPIVPFDELMAVATDKEQAANRIDEMRKNRVFSYFYLPEQNGLPEGFVDFTRMMAVSSRYLNMLKKTSPEHCILSLSQTGYYLFLIKLTYYLARMETSDSLRPTG
jgi:hypothetical protein